MPANHSVSTADREFVDSRLIDAPQERVFKAFAEPAHLANMTIKCTARGNKTLVVWRHVFDTAGHKERVARYVTEANEQNLSRLADAVLCVS